MQPGLWGDTASQGRTRTLAKPAQRQPPSTGELFASLLGIELGTQKELGAFWCNKDKRDIMA